MIPRFSDAMALHRVGGGPNTEAEFEADLNENWTIGPKVHGGVMVALCAKAARVAYNRGPDDSASPVASPVAQPVAVSANFLSAPDPGAVRLVTAVRKRGRRIGLVDVELIQGDRSCVHAVVTLGEPEHDAQPLWVDAPLSALVPAQPPADDQQPRPRLRHPPEGYRGTRRRPTADVHLLGAAQGGSRRRVLRPDVR
jgi:acyl-coenzyme A thioesterase PaaI-like protein